MASNITVAPEQTTETPITFDFSGPASSLTDENAQVRTKKYDYALGPSSPGPDVIYSKIRNNEENVLRDFAAKNQQVKDEELRANMITNATKSFGGKLTPDQFNYLSTLSTDALRSPDTILENAYANKIFSDSYDTQEDSPVDRARATQPETVNFVEDYANNVLQNHEVLKKVTEDIDLKWSEKSTVGKIGDYLWNVVPFTTWADMSNEIEGKPGGSFLLGNNMKEQVQYAWSLPPDQFAKLVPSTIREIADVNVNDAESFVKALYSYSNTDAAWNNLGSLFDLSTIADVAAGVGKGALKAAGKGAGAAAAIQATKDTTFIGKALREALKPSPADLKNVEKNTLRDMGAGRRISGTAANDDMSTAGKLVTPGEKTIELTPQPSASGKSYGKYAMTPEQAAKTVGNTANDDFMASKDAFRGTVSNMSRNEVPDASEILSSAGKTDGSVFIQTYKDMQEKINSGVAKSLRNGPSKEQMDQLLKEVPSFADPLSVFKGNFSLDAESMRRVLNKLYGVFDNSFNILSDTTQLERLTTEQQAAAIKAAQDQIKREYPSLNSAIHDVNWLPVDAGNVHHVEMTLKRPDGTPFQSVEKAKYFAETEVGLREGYTIGTQGNGYTVKITRAVDETAPEVRDALVGFNQTPGGVLEANAVSGFFRTANDLLSPWQNATRKTAVHAVEKPNEWGYRMAAPLRALNKKSREKLTRFTETLRDYVSKDGTVGKDYKNQGDFEKAWQDSFGTLPNAKETAAFYAQQRFNDLDYLQRNILMYRMKARQGYARFTLTPMEQGKGIPAIDMKNVTKDLKFADIDNKAGIYLWDTDKKQEQFFQKGDAGLSSAKIQEFLDNEGYQLLQVYEPYARPLAESTGKGEIINFVLTKNYSRENLPFKQIKYNPGGHKLYDYEHYIKQPRVHFIGNRRVYSSDVTIRPAATQKLGSHFAKMYDDARILYRDQKFPELKAFLEKNLMEDFNEFTDYFASGRLDKDLPITSIRSNERTVDNPLFKNRLGNYEDARNDPYNDAGRTGIDFLGDRNLDLAAVHSDSMGTEGNPLLALRTPKLVDPLSTISRAFGSLSKNMILDDYRIASAEHFVKEFGDVLGMSADVLKNNPMAGLFTKNFSGDAGRIAAAKNYQRKVQDLLGVRTETQKNLAWIKEKMYNSVYDNWGETTADKIDDVFISKIDDPTRFLRSVAFHLKLGLFMPLQLFKQAQTMGMVMAMGESKAALKGFPAYFLVQSLRMSNGNEAILRKVAGVAGKFGWKEDHFIEWYNQYMKSGLNIIKGEHAFKDAVEAPNIVTGNIGNYISKSSFFFEEGERTHRAYSSATAYLEWRQKNPVAVMTPRDWEKIMLRSDDLTVNMTRASNASWQKGIVSVPAQFFSYQARLWELMLGKRTTAAEKAKILGVQSALYGVPVALTGNIVGVWPWYQDIRKSMLERKQNPDNFAAEAFHGGLVEATLKLISGENYDVGESYGPTGLPFLKDAADGKGMWEILLGAAGGTFSEVIRSAAPIVTDVSEMLSEGPGEGSRAILASDLQDFGRNSSSFNHLLRLYYAHSLSKYVTKNGVTIDDDVSTFDTFMSAFGVNKQEVNDAFLMSESNKDYKEAQTEAKKQFSKYINQYWNSVRNGDSESVQTAYWKRSLLWYKAGDFNPGEFVSMISQASSNKSLIDAVNQKFMMEGPFSQRAQRQGLTEGNQ